MSEFLFQVTGPVGATKVVGHGKTLKDAITSFELQKHQVLNNIHNPQSFNGEIKPSDPAVPANRERSL